MNLTEIARKFRVSDNYLNSKEDGLTIVAASLKDIIAEMNSGNIDVNADYYICCSDVHIKEFCDANSLTFPYDYSDKSLRDKIWTWGVVFNRTTGEPTHVKAYERTFV